MSTYRGTVVRADDAGIFVNVPERGAVFGPMEVTVSDGGEAPAYATGDRVLVQSVGVTQSDDFVIVGHRKRINGVAGTVPLPAPGVPSIPVVAETLLEVFDSTTIDFTLTGDRETGYQLTGSVVGAGGAPVVIADAGTMRMWGGDTAPTGWLMCDGSAVLRTAYAELFAAIGTKFGAGDGSTTFNLPNFKGRVPVGHDPSDPDFDTLGNTGGEKDHALTEAELAAHTHTTPAHTHAVTVTDPGHNHSQNSHTHNVTTDFTKTGTYNNMEAVPAYGVNEANSGQNRWYYASGTARSRAEATTAMNNANTTGITATVPSGGAGTSGSTGTGDAHNNMPPYVTVNVIISTGAATGTVSSPTTFSVTDSASVDFMLTGNPTAGYDLSASVVMASVRDFIYPIGAIYMSVNSTDPGTLFGGTWAAWGTGQVPVGVDTAQTEFNTVEKTGGEKTHTLTAAEMPRHSHTIPNEDGQPPRRNAGASAGRLPGVTYASYTDASVSTNAAGSDGAHNNLPPYITCYMWKRTA